jgi:hypothetical protein
MDRSWVQKRREARVEGWESRDDLTDEQKDGIRHYLETGKKDGLPEEYAEKPGAHIVTARKRKAAQERVDALMESLSNPPAEAPTEVAS